MRRSFTESDIDPMPYLDPAFGPAAAERIAEQEQAAGWVDPDMTRLVPVSAIGSASTRLDPEPAEALGDTVEVAKGFLGLSPTQILGGALASSTAAVAGSQLGVAGTVAGAALTSIVAAVASAAYTRSLSKTGSGLGVVVSRFRPGGTTQLKHVPGITEDTGLTQTALTGAASIGTHVTAAPEFASSSGSDARASWRDRFSPVHLLATAAAVFLLAAVVVTGLEALRGESFSGNGQTTVGQISREGISGGSTTRSGTADTNDSDSDRSGAQDESTQPAITPTPTASQTAVPGGSNTPTATPTTSTSAGADAGSTGTDSAGNGGADTEGTGTSGDGPGPTGATGSGSGSGDTDSGTTGLGSSSTSE